MTLPAGLTTRPLTVADARAVFEIAAAVEEHEIGRVSVEEADIVGDWQRPSFDVEASTIGVVDGDLLVGYAEDQGHERSDAGVLPSHYGRGIGTHLSQWLREHARARGAAIIGMPVPQGSTGDRLLEHLGYHVRWTSWVLQLPAGAEIAERPLPDGYAVRPASEPDLEAAHEVLEDAFLEWSDRDRESLADFRAVTLERPGFEPWMLRVVTDDADHIVAVAVVLLADDGEAYINRLATRADQRRKGLAQALMVDSFRAGREHGATSFGLSTDSRTGALDLYRKVGMDVVDVWVHRAFHLR